MILAAKPRPARVRDKTQNQIAAILDRLFPNATSSLDRDWEALAHQLGESETEYLYNAEFASSTVAEEILTAEPLNDAPDAAAWKLGKALPAHLARLCETKLLKPQEERNLFRRMNFAKYLADVLRRRIDPEGPDRRLMSQVQQLLSIAHSDRDRLVRANLRLVVSIAKKFADARHSFDDLLSDGITSLLKAVEKFDYDRGFRFSTYATQAVRRTLCRGLQTSQRERSRFLHADASLFEALPEDEQPSSLTEARFLELRRTLARLLGKLDPRERAIVRNRFGLDKSAEVKTLQALAADMGVCKERVRQLEVRAINKLRTMAGEVKLQPPEEV